MARKSEHPARRRRRQQSQRRQARRSGKPLGPSQQSLQSGNFNPRQAKSLIRTVQAEVSPGEGRSAQVRRRSQAAEVVKLEKFRPASLRSVPKNTSQRPKQGQTPRRSLRLGSMLLLSILRLVILGIGVGAIAGTGFALWGLAGRSGSPNSEETASTASPSATPSPTNPFDAALQRKREMSLLKPQVQVLVAAQPKLKPGMFFLNLDTGAYLDLAGSEPLAAASLIKVPVLVAFFQDVDAGKIRLDEQLVMRPDLIAAGSGEMQYKTPGSQFSALETATKMIVISDNTATNLLIDRLGGPASLNQRFQSWGLSTTVIRNLLADLEGTNTTSPEDLSKLMTLVSQGNLVSVRSRDRMLDIMRQTVTNTLLPKGLGEGARIAHKTGDIGSMVGDTGLIDMPNGQRYVATVMVQRPHNDSQAKELIRQTSRLVYNHLNQPLVNPQIPASSPAGSPAVNPAPPLPD